MRTRKSIKTSQKVFRVNYSQKLFNKSQEYTSVVWTSSATLSHPTLHQNLNQQNYYHYHQTHPHCRQAQLIYGIDLINKVIQYNTHLR